MTPVDWWRLAAPELLAALSARERGLSGAEVAERQAVHGPNRLQDRDQASPLRLFLDQLRSPLVLILLFAASVSAIVREWTDAAIIIVVVLGSAILGFVQEYRASSAIAKLRSHVTLRARVLRDGVEQQVPAESLVPGDMVLLTAGSLVPADGLVLEADDFFVNQAVLTGETFPMEKIPAPVAADAGIAARTNTVFMGTSVRSGSARVLLVETGRRTVFGQVADRLSLRPPETEFERGIQRFGYLLTQVMVAMVLVVLAANILLDKPPVDSLLFALALAVGLAPELLPAIISITLAHGALQMAKRGVIVRRLNAIENFGGMDVLCTDKTGTLTEGVVRLDGALDIDGKPSAAVLRLAAINARLQTAMNNPLDDAIGAAADAVKIDSGAVRKIDEIPYDFVRKRLSVVVTDGGDARLLITKGALRNVLDLCSQQWRGDAVEPLDAAARARIDAQFDAWSAQGFRVLGVAQRPVDAGSDRYARDIEQELVFVGFLLFFDPPKAGVAQVITDLAARGVAIKVITGDNLQVALHVAEAVGLKIEGALTGRELDQLRDEALWNVAARTTLFAEVDPNQKERVILALQKSGHVVGYLGDGINDAPALHAADVGISVDTAVDVAKDAADFVLLKQDLDVLREGIDGGRTTFANTLKYILTTISANFGNMFSMAAASIFLPFLPLLAPQILLNNFLSDIPAAAIASDNVDPDWVRKPRRWNLRFIRNYMVSFGLVSSLFDFLAFAILLLVFHTGPDEFRTGWFIESLLTELVIALVIRTRHRFWRSRPGNFLLWSTIGVIALALVLPYLPASSMFGFVPLPAPLLAAIVGLTVLYVIATEYAKSVSYRHHDH